MLFALFYVYNFICWESVDMLAKRVILTPEEKAQIKVEKLEKLGFIPLTESKVQDRYCFDSVDGEKDWLNLDFDELSEIIKRQRGPGYREYTRDRKYFIRFFESVFHDYDNKWERVHEMKGKILLYKQREYIDDASELQPSYVYFEFIPVQPYGMLFNNQD
jgi:hypothetical protein